MPFSVWAHSIVAFAAAAGAVWLPIDGSALRDGGAPPLGAKPTFSLARVQLWFWTVLILGSYLAAAICTPTAWELNETCLILLGISATTTTGARILDARQDPFGESTASVAHPTQNFLTDILSDERGVSIHRFQTVVFTLAFGARFLSVVYTSITIGTGGFPTFDATAFGLLGLSSATYLALKSQEAAPPKPAAAPSSDPDGVLADTDETPLG